MNIASYPVLEVKVTVKVSKPWMYESKFFKVPLISSDDEISTCIHDQLRYVAPYWILDDLTELCKSFMTQYRNHTGDPFMYKYCEWIQEIGSQIEKFQRDNLSFFENIDIYFINLGLDDFSVMNIYRSTTDYTHHKQKETNVPKREYVDSLHEWCLDNLYSSRDRKLIESMSK